MDDQSNVPGKTRQSPNTSVVLVQGQSTAALIQAIHSPGDEAYVMERAKTCLKLFYEPDMTAQDRVGMLESFARALRFIPKWAVSRAFDVWERDNTRRPAPGNIVKLARDEVKRFSDEVAYRERQAQLPPASDSGPRGPTPQEKEMASRVLQQAGFTPRRLELTRDRPMAGSVEELEAVPDREPHWTELVDPDGPEMAQLRKSRDENKLIQQARAAQAKKDAAE